MLNKGVRTQTFQLYLTGFHGASPERVPVRHAVSPPYTQCESAKPEKNTNPRIKLIKKAKSRKKQSRTHTKKTQTHIA